MADDIVEQRLQILDAMRDAGDVGMNGDRHDPRVGRALEVQPVELIGAALEELLGRQMLQSVDDDIVGFHRIGDCRHRAVWRRDVLRQVVDHPVRQIFDAVEAQQIERLVVFGQARAFPRPHRLARKFRDRVDGPLDGIGLVLQFVHRPLDEAVAHEFKTGLQRGRGDARIGTAYAGVQRQGHRDVPVGEGLELPPEPGAHAVFMP
ncbi:hypothetical protein GALL_550850 [mine drainage metagenome]|uniref:Uncharacterized protein n=1 Tax=mine drainage metagenome TaxID=410659 RepID=A0A1J5NX84_9ZZZZ